MKRISAWGLVGASLVCGFVVPAARAAGASEPMIRETVRIAVADPFSALVGKSRTSDASNAVTRFDVASGERAFLLEGRVGEVRIKFLCGEGDPRVDCTLDPLGPAEEIILATGVRGSRGDVNFADAEGDQLLRIMPYGGATVHWPGKPQGEAASQTFGEDGALVLPFKDHQDAVRRAARATARLSAMTGSTIVFDAGAPSPYYAARAFAAAPAIAPPVSAKAEASAAALADAAPAAEARAGEIAPTQAGDASVLADAVVRAAAGMDEVASDPTGARVLGSRIGVVRFRQGEPPRLSLDGRTLTVIYDPAADVAGRPSSRAIVKFLENSL